MGMMELKKQLIKIREIVSRADEVENEIGEMLNNYRTEVLETIEGHDKSVMTSLIRPLKTNDKFIRRNLALILCDQLLEIL